MNETQRGEIVQENKFEENKLEENNLEEETVTEPANKLSLGNSQFGVRWNISILERQCKRSKFFL